MITKVSGRSITLKDLKGHTVTLHIDERKPAILDIAIENLGFVAEISTTRGRITSLQIPIPDPALPTTQKVRA